MMNGAKTFHDDFPAAFIDRNIAGGIPAALPLVERNSFGETRLHVACTDGNFDDVKRLLDAGHPTNSRDKAGKTALHKAANRGYVGIVKCLIDFGANVNDSGRGTCGDDAVDFGMDPIEIVISS